MNFSGIGKFLRNHAPGILMGMGTVGSVTAVIFTAKAVKPAMDALSDCRMEKAIETLNSKPNDSWNSDFRIVETPDISFKDKFRVCWKYFVPGAGLEIFALMCFWAAHGIDVKRQAVIAGLYSTAEAALSEYQKKVIDTIGDKANDQIKADISSDRVRQMEPMPALPSTTTDIWCVIDNRRFPSTYNKIKQVQNEFNHQMLSDMYKSRAELYWMLDPSGDYLRPYGDDFEVGWCIDKLLILRVDDPTAPVLVVEYEDKDGMRYPPKPGFSTSML